MIEPCAFEYDKHYEEANSWGRKHNFPLPGREYLPDIGFVVPGLAVGFLYTSNSKIGWVEWVFGNPEASKDDRAQAIDLVIKLIEYCAKDLGIEALFSSSGSPAYQSVLERHGFDATDKNVTQYIKKIGGESCQP